MIDTDDPVFKYGYRSAIHESLSQINKTVEGGTIQHDWKVFEEYRNSINQKSVHKFEDGWALGVLTVKAAVANWLQAPKIFVNYKLPLKKLVVEIAEKYQFDMADIDRDYDDEIKTAIFFLDISRKPNGIV